VSGQFLPNPGRYHEDNAVLTLEFPDGSLGTLSYLANGDKAYSKERVEVFGGGRTAVLDDFRTLELSHHGQRQAAHARLRQDKGHQAEWLAFAQAVQQGGPPPIPYPHLFGVSRLAVTALQALRSGERLCVDQGLQAWQ
jgi:predicted dehydrogenase